ncbi:PopZ family protein [Mesorhizobium soli]|uniref:DUF2497 domain-containing protein n=1 Tax=Pseudaminobacter soli (ex Li et al. 2025) TaxID=1295366 RepID=A0A2P7S806_9HYPH|nr:PopZ family protein [Mesorhizobium soli]PSJ58597.1 DUF2497 domain-containing protein [Mesorhizobium soli]
MAQANSVQREPSMEEILASIRRIIEDSDGIRKGPEDMTGRVDVRDEPLDNAVIEVDAFRAELRAARAPEVEPSPTLADVQARIAAEEAIAPQSLSAAFEPEMPIVQDEPVEAPAPVVAEWNVAAEPLSEPEASFDTEFEAAFQELPVEQTVEEKASLPESIAVAPREIGKSTIISEHTGRQVAAAFGELSEAFAARSRKTFDEMAEQMLRPMLQDWLDNNLPTLVERLVREEIERVARSG